MTGVWITLARGWEFADVQAALNVVISVIGATGIWSLSRFWWQRAAKRVLANDGPVSLSSLFTFTSLGEAYDVTTFFRTRLFTKNNWTLLAQLIVVIVATLLTTFAGPLARISLRSELVVYSRETSILKTSKGGGSFGNLISANVLWNDTIASLNYAGFPLDQILEYVPSLSTPWVYREAEWDPTWHIDCNHTDEIFLHQLTATGNYSLKDPTKAYPGFGNTFELFWLNTSNYRREIFYEGWNNFNEKPQVKQMVYFILIQTDPEIDDQLYHNQNPLRFSLTAFHLEDVELRSKSEQLIGSSDQVPVGIAGKASYTRTQCVVSRNTQAREESAVPWIWTNETQSIVFAMSSFYAYSVQNAGAHKTTFKSPSARELLRFYQAYMSSVNTNASPTSTRKISVHQRAVGLSCITLTIILLIFVLNIWNSGRYIIFACIREKAKIETVYIPDSKIAWMVYAARDSETGMDIDGGIADRDRFRDAVFACHDVSKPGRVLSKSRSNLTMAMTQNGGLAAKSQHSTNGSSNSGPHSTPTAAQSVHTVSASGIPTIGASNEIVAGASSTNTVVPSPSTVTPTTASTITALQMQPSNSQTTTTSPQTVPSTSTQVPDPISMNIAQVNKPAENPSLQVAGTVEP